jgi:hypothetical protein
MVCPALQACELHEQRAARIEDGLLSLARTMERSLVGHEGRAGEMVQPASTEHESAALRTLNAAMHQLFAKVHTSMPCHSVASLAADGDGEIA